MDIHGVADDVGSAKEVALDLILHPQFPQDSARENMSSWETVMEKSLHA
jgi:hypothetical protein